MNDLRERIIFRIVEMHHGIGNGTPQPEYAQYIAERYDARLPWLDIAAGVKAAMKESA